MDETMFAALVIGLLLGFVIGRRTAPVARDKYWIALVREFAPVSQLAAMLSP